VGWFGRSTWRRLLFEVLLSDMSLCYRFLGIVYFLGFLDPVNWFVYGYSEALLVVSHFAMWGSVYLI